MSNVEIRMKEYLASASQGVINTANYAVAHRLINNERLAKAIKLTERRTFERGDTLDKEIVTAILNLKEEIQFDYQSVYFVLTELVLFKLSVFITKQYSAEDSTAFDTLGVSKQLKDILVDVDNNIEVFRYLNINLPRRD